MEQGAISKSFYAQLLTVITIATSSIVGFNYVADKSRESISEAIKTEMSPLIKRVDDLERKYFSLDEIMKSNCDGVKAINVSVTHFIDAFNKTHNTAFLKPNDIEFVDAKKRKKEEE